MQHLLRTYERRLKTSRFWAPVTIVLLFCLQAMTLTAQVRTVTGKVTDAQGQVLEGATVRVKGGNQAVVTDATGTFTIKANPGEKLLVSHINYKEVEIAASPGVLVRMLTSDKSLDDVVVVGYGQQKKATLTGAVEQVSSKAFESRAVTNIGLALQGETPGLVVTRNSPRPGNEGLAFRIRGATSVNGSDPLVVVDGVPVLNSYSFLNLNSDDIESVSVLKDGAAAIYGSRAANGVILVTTKRGKGKLKVDYNGNVRFTTNGIIAYSPSMQQYATMWLEANKEETVPNYWVWASKDNLLKMQQGVEGAYQLYNRDFYIFNANRIKEMFSTRYSFQHNLSLGSRTEKGGYRLSFGYADNRGNLSTAYDGQKQYNARFNTDYKLSEKLKLETNISFVHANTSTPSFGLDNTL
ncbi:MAG: TonB-dependent receptor plug domain-containing protein, partial [Bacteroidetes bacterium]|nr:TonB-dependent receptor plug domain-containing protein [Bacteroidota bacterium]